MAFVHYTQGYFAMNTKLFDCASIKKYARLSLVIPVFFAGPIFAEPPAQSGPNVTRVETPLWFFYSTDQYVVIHGNDVVAQCIRAFNTGDPSPVFSGTWSLQIVSNPNTPGLVNVIAKAGEELKSWVFPARYFQDEAGNLYSGEDVCWNMVFGGDWPTPEIARGLTHVIARDNNAFAAETKRAKSWGFSAHGVLHTPLPDSQEVLLNSGFHCVATEDPANPKCNIRIILQE